MNRTKYLAEFRREHLCQRFFRAGSRMFILRRVSINRRRINFDDASRRSVVNKFYQKTQRQHNFGYKLIQIPSTIKCVRLKTDKLLIFRVPILVSVRLISFKFVVQEAINKRVYSKSVNVSGLVPGRLRKFSADGKLPQKVAGHVPFAKFKKFRM